MEEGEEPIADTVAVEKFELVVAEEPAFAAVKEFWFAVVGIIESAVAEEIALAVVEKSGFDFVVDFEPAAAEYFEPVAAVEDFVSAG